MASIASSVGVGFWSRLRRHSSALAKTSASVNLAIGFRTVRAPFLKLRAYRESFLTALKWISGLGVARGFGKEQHWPQHYSGQENL